MHFKKNYHTLKFLPINTLPTTERSATNTLLGARKEGHSLVYLVTIEAVLKVTSVGGLAPVTKIINKTNKRMGKLIQPHYRV